MLCNMFPSSGCYGPYQRGTGKFSLYGKIFTVKKKSLFSFYMWLIEKWITKQAFKSWMYINLGEWNLQVNRGFHGSGSTGDAGKGYQWVHAEWTDLFMGSIRELSNDEVLQRTRWNIKDGHIAINHEQGTATRKNKEAVTINMIISNTQW